jgi:hypothetical protein
VRDGGRHAVGGGDPPGNPRGFGNHLERRVGVAEDGGSHQRRPFLRASRDGEAFRAEKRHALEQVPVGHLLDARNGIERKRGPFIGNNIFD